MNSLNEYNFKADGLSYSWVLTQPAQRDATVCWVLDLALWFVEAPHFTLAASLVRVSHLWFCSVVKALRAKKKRTTTHTWAWNTQIQIQPSTFPLTYALFIEKYDSVEPFVETSHVFWDFLSYLPHQTLPLLFEACQLWLSNVSGMKRQRPISPSLFLTAPHNHLHAISNISDDRQIACSISCPHWIPFTPLSSLPSLRLLAV